MSGDLDLKRMLAEIFVEDDKQRAGEDAFERRIAELQAQRRDNPQLVHKTFETPRRAIQAAQPQQQPDSDGIIPLPAHVQKRWAEWADQRADNRIKVALADFKKMLGEKLSSEFDKILKDIAASMGSDYRDLNEKIIALQCEVGALRVDLEVRDAAQIIDLPDWRGKRANG
jgi:hypothetical protein